MIDFIFLQIIFFLAGAKNGSYYAQKAEHNMWWILSIFILAGFYILSHDIIWLIFPLLTVLFWQVIVFEKNLGKQIHLSDRALSMTLRGIMVFCGANLIMMVLSSFLTMVAFKMPINLYIGRKPIEVVDGTDNPTGKTVDIWIFGKQYHIPRVSNGYVQLALGVLGTIIWVVLEYYGITLKIK